MATQPVKRIDKHKDPKNSLKSVLFIVFSVLLGETVKLAIHHQLSSKLFLAISAALGGIILLTLLFILIDRTIKKVKSSGKPV